MKRFTFIVVLVLICALPVRSQMVDSVDTPYKKDEHTILLLHFDNKIISDFNTNVNGSYSYISADGGQRPNAFEGALQMDNDSPEDSTYVQIQDSTSLDLQGSWTIEMWFAAVGYTPQDSSWFNNSVLWAKVGSDTGEINYKTYIKRAGNSNIVTEYNTKKQDSVLRFKSKGDVYFLGHWTHVALVRNVQASEMKLFVHEIKDDGDITLKHKQTWQIEGNSLATNNAPLYLGGGLIPNHLGPFHDGLIDEFRISDTVRTYARSTDLGDPVGNVPNKFRLKQNYPNPFNPSTNIRFSLPQSEQVRINIYNSIGQKIETLINRQMTAGSHSVTFNAEDLPSGVYIYRLKAGEYTESRKMLLVK